MPDIRTNARSFAGGAIAAELYGRIDHVKYATGLAVCRNFLPLPHGPVTNRAGTHFVRAARYANKKARLIPFTFSTSQTMVLEIGEGYVRFHTQGATLLAPVTAWSGATAYAQGDTAVSGGVTYYCTAAHTNHAPPNGAYWYPMASTAYEMPLPYQEADIFDIRYVQSADVLTLTHTLYPPAEIRRYSATRWTYSVIAFGATIAAPQDVSAEATPGDDPGPPSTQSYVITAVAADGSESVASAAAQGLTKTITSANWPLGQIVLSGSTPSEWSAGDFVKLSGSAYDAVYVVDRATNTGGVTLKLKTLNGGDVNLAGTTAGGNAIQLGVRNNLFDDGAVNTMRWTPVVGAVRYNVYKSTNGLYGYIGQTDQTIFIDDSIAGNVAQTPPIDSKPFTGGGNYPTASSYYEQRRVFGGTVLKSQNLWLTKPSTEVNLNLSIPTRDDDAIAFRIASRQINSIQHFVPMQALVILTSSAVWRVTSVNTDALTPLSFSVKPQSAVGANGVQPLQAKENAVYAGARGGHLYEISYSWQQNGYVSADLSRYNPELFDNRTVVDMAFSESPYPVIWAVSSAGFLISVTYVPEEQVAGLAQHDSGSGYDETVRAVVDGAFESVACVAEGLEDRLYAVVRRTVNGSTVRYVERMASRYIADQADAYFVDAGISYSGAAIDEITSGLAHLEGKTVNILGDGAVMPQQVVTGGGLPLPLDAECTKIHIGLPIDADVKTLPVVLDTDGFGQGRSKNVNKVWLRVDRSSGIFAGPDFGNLTQFKQRTNENYGSAPALASGEIEIGLDNAWGDGGQVCIRQSDPLPVTIVSMTAEVSIGG